MKNNTILGTLHLGFPKSTYLRNLDNAISVCNCKWPGIPAQSPRFSLVLKHSKVADVIIDYLLICRLPWTFWRGICSIVHIGVLILVEKTSMKGQRWDHTRISDGGTTRLLISLSYGEGVRGGGLCCTTAKIHNIFNTWREVCNVEVSIWKMLFFMTF